MGQTPSQTTDIPEQAPQANARQPHAPRTPQEAAAHIRELRKGVTLGGLKIKDLIHAGHKY
jgi:hypothetical protein